MFSTKDDTPGLRLMMMSMKNEWCLRATDTFEHQRTKSILTSALQVALNNATSILKMTGLAHSKFRNHKAFFVRFWYCSLMTLVFTLYLSSFQRQAHLRLSLYGPYGTSLRLLPRLHSRQLQREICTVWLRPPVFVQPYQASREHELGFRYCVG